MRFGISEISIVILYKTNDLLWLQYKSRQAFRAVQSPAFLKMDSSKRLIDRPLKYKKGIFVRNFNSKRNIKDNLWDKMLYFSDIPQYTNHI